MIYSIDDFFDGFFSMFVQIIDFLDTPVFSFDNGVMTYNISLWQLIVGSLVAYIVVAALVKVVRA